MIADKHCATCGVNFRKRYAKNRTEPKFCCRRCADMNSDHQKAKAVATAKTRWPADKMTTISCKGCEKAVIVNSRTKRKQTYCSTQCKYRSMIKNEIIAFKCATCGKNKTGSLRDGLAIPTYCSRACMGKDQERNARISQATRLKMADPEIRERTRRGHAKVCATPEWKEQRREIMLAAYARGSFNEQSLTKPVRAVCAMLDKLNVKYSREKIFGHYAFDFYLPEHHAFIEVQGDYWHGNPAKYDKCELTAKQKRRQNIDKTKASYAKKRDLPTLAIWEADIARCPDQCEEDIQMLITSRLISISGFRSKVT